MVPDSFKNRLFLDKYEFFAVTDFFMQSWFFLFFYLFVFAYALGYLRGLIISEKHGIVITGLFFIILSLPD